MALTSARYARNFLFFFVVGLLSACGGGGGGGDDGGGFANISLSANARSSTEIALSWPAATQAPGIHSCSARPDPGRTCP
jgi:hypothetical protein